MTRKPWLYLVLLAIFLGSFAGSCDEKGLGDAPIGKQHEAPRDIIVMPDTFPNFAIACDGTTAIYAHTRDAAPIVVTDSVWCDGKGDDAASIVDSTPSEFEDE